MAELSLRTRQDVLERLGRDTFDVVVIGGGITGAGVALDAASRGLRVALVERADLGSGTSSRSSRLVHGGVRYLRQGAIGLVRESLEERARLLANAPHLVRPLAFVVPRFRRGRAQALGRGAGVGLWLYDALGGARLGRHRRLSAADATALVPGLDARALAHAWAYSDATVDDARLTLTVARSAAGRGAALATRCVAVAIEPPAGGVATVHCRDELGGGLIEVRARAVVNAAGVWSDAVRALADGDARSELRPAKGVHVTVARAALPTTAAALLPAPDGRFVFVVPWGEVTLVGTTDTPYGGGLDDPGADEDEIAYLLDAVNGAAAQPLERADVVGVYAGLRPLVAGDSRRTSDLSRRHRVDERNGVVTITGGKLTTYRRMAEDAVDLVSERVLPGVGHSRTRGLALHGAAPATPPPGVPRHLHERFGADAPSVLALARAEDLGRPLVEGLPYLEAEVVWAARSELAILPEDVLERRTRLATEVRDRAAAAERVAALLAAEPGAVAAPGAAGEAR
ncbi:MAG TPA: glycerol-3-phosphate dehydrogenase/oxidase [Gaiellaceae bacterium]|nr:glycerol-3-phosphate dehydrogenase/oxidase [Gaiellaceae bacterium]